MDNKLDRGAFTLRFPLKKHLGEIYRMALSSDGIFLASTSVDHTVRISDCRSGTEFSYLEGHTGDGLCAAWSPNGRYLAIGGGTGACVWDLQGSKRPIATFQNTAKIYTVSWHPGGATLATGSNDGTITLWSLAEKKILQNITNSGQCIQSLAWSPEGTSLCSGTEKGSIHLLDMNTGVTAELLGHKGSVASITWCKNYLVTASKDRTIRVWDLNLGRQLFVLEGHTSGVASVASMAGGRLIVSLAEDGDLIVWNSETWAEVAQMRKFCASNYFANIAAHETLPLLIACGDRRDTINVWALDFALLLRAPSDSSTIFYVNAKAVLLGESGVGKSGLGMRLAERTFRPTEGSTHGAQFWHFAADQLPDCPPTLRPELTLWDLAGQPEYRLTHQLFLDDTDAALLLFDSSDSNDSFRGVPYWAKVLKKQAPPHSLKILVSARSDVSPPTADSREIEHVLETYGLDAYFVTSARNGNGVQALFDYVLTNLPWQALPRTSTPLLFQVIREFLLERKAMNDALISMDLIRDSAKRRYQEREPQQIELDTVIQLLQSRGVVHRVDTKPGISWVLLKPELVNQYGASIVQAARNHPMGIGSVIEREVLTGNMDLGGVARLPAAEERLVIEATVELLIRHDICFREMGYLVFPSQFKVTRRKSDYKESRTEVAYRFSGSIESIFASLVVRLSYTDYFQREDHWKYAVEFSCQGGRLGFSMYQVVEGTAELGIYFDNTINEFDRVTFIRFVTEHLKTKGIDIQEHIRLYCPKCSREVSDHLAIEARIKSGELGIPCQYCTGNILIPKSIEERYRNDKDLVQAQAKLAETVERRTAIEIENFQTDSHHYTEGERSKGIKILHLSDLHIQNDALATIFKTQLETDLIQELGIKRLDYLVISGDVGDRATDEEYKAAFGMVDALVKRFGLDPTRVLVVPGNHDVNWDSSESSYKFFFANKVPFNTPPGRQIAAGDVGVLVSDDLLYRDRFANFSTHFYRRVEGGLGYPSDYRDQVQIKEHPEQRILFLGLNTAWELDHHFRDRASVNVEALSRALDRLGGKPFDDWLKIAVWHHPISGPGSMETDFMQLLAIHGFQVCMHGHIHEAIDGFHKYDQGRSLRIVGAGTFGAPTQQQVPGIPLQYNLLTYELDSGVITVETRKKERPKGSWSADARWGDKNAPKPSYNFKVEYKSI